MESRDLQVVIANRIWIEERSESMGFAVKDGDHDASRSTQLRTGDHIFRSLKKRKIFL
jgi:hypothetical protein